MPRYYPIPDNGPVGQMLAATKRHPFRPAHLHFIIDAPGHAKLITHVFRAGDVYLDSDAVFGVKNSLIREFAQQPPGVAPDGRRMEQTWRKLSYDFGLKPLACQISASGRIAMDPFIYEQASRRVVFGTGTRRQVRAETERPGLKRVVVLSTREQSEHALEVADILASSAAESFSEALMHTPVDVAEGALAVVKSKGADGIVAVGGGSTFGLGKAIALRADLPLIVIPTTYAGSEMTLILGETSGGRKTTQSTPKVLPELAIYDVDMTLTSPPALSATSGMNAIAHAVRQG